MRPPGARAGSSSAPRTSAPAPIAFYGACGFRNVGVRARFFDAYPHPVVEDGRVAHDMVLFERALTAGDDG